MKSIYQSDEDLALEIQQIEHEVAALEIAVKRKKLRLTELRSDQHPSTPTRVSIGQEDRNNRELHIEDRVKVLTSSKNKSFVVGTEAVVTGVTPQKQVKISNRENREQGTWRDSRNLELIDQHE